MKLQSMFVIFTALSTVAVGCSKNDSSSAKSADNASASSFDWSYDRPGKSSSSGTVHVDINNSALTIKEVEDFTAYPIGTGHSERTLDTASKQATLKGSNNVTTPPQTFDSKFDGSSADLVQQIGFNRVVRDIIRTLNSTGPSSSNNNLAQRDQIVAQLKTLLIATSYSFEWNVSHPGKSFDELNVKITKSGNDLVISETSQYSVYNTPNRGNGEIHLDTAAKTASMSQTTQGDNAGTVANSYNAKGGDDQLRGYQTVIGKLGDALNQTDSIPRSAEDLAKRDDILAALQDALSAN